MFHIGLGGCVLLLVLLVCCGGPAAVQRFLAGVSCLIAIQGGLIALLFLISSCFHPKPVVSRCRAVGIHSPLPRRRGRW
jgi:hypothetical protein